MSHYYAFIRDLTHFKRRKTVGVHVGDLGFGSAYPMRLQSMTTVDTMDTEGSIQQSIRMIESGCELVRITAPNLKAAKNLAYIKKGLEAKGYKTPLVADIHFTPNAAEWAARIIEKVRINPGNYADKKRFKTFTYDDDSYKKELERIRKKFLPLVKICKEYGTALRIGTNHGSLSDRIMSRYGDTPLGMVESALEFLRICEQEHYYNIILSMKASNTQIMVQAYRLLVKKIDEEGLKPYPLHLGVTEAGDGQEGRIKSALGIGTLLEDGLGDTIRVSLTEEPEYEIPVANILAQRYQKMQSNPSFLSPIAHFLKDPYQYEIHDTQNIHHIGGANPPIVISDWKHLKNFKALDLKRLGYYYLENLDKWESQDIAGDFIYSGTYLPDFEFPKQLKLIVDSTVWNSIYSSIHTSIFPLFDQVNFFKTQKRHKDLNFLILEACTLGEKLLSKLEAETNTVIILNSSTTNRLKSLRNAALNFIKYKIRLPVIFNIDYSNLDFEKQTLYASADLGALLIEGLGAGIMLTDKQSDFIKSEQLNSLAFGILQAARRRITKTEYISCPSCGRTLFDLQETTALIRRHTEHLKGIKIGIMGCIVNGPGEMADADYGYVGSGKGKITLYKNKEIIKSQVPAQHAVEELINIIKTDGAWVEP